MISPESETPLNRARAHVEASVRVHERVREQARTLVHVATAICEALQQGGRVRFFDGSAGGDARRWVADLAPRLHGRYAHQLIAPSGATPASMMAPRFSRAVSGGAELEGLGGADVAIGIAAGPAAESVLNELRRAQERGAAAVVAFAGKQGEEAATFCTRAVVIPSEDAARVHEALVLCRHIVVDLVSGALEASRPPAEHLRSGSASHA